MANTGVKYPTATAELTQAPYDDVAWTSVANIKANDSNVGYYNGVALDDTKYSRVGVGKTFAAGVPAGATINGIVVEVEVGQYGGTPAHDYLVQLSKDGTTRVGNNKGANVNLGGLGVHTYGGAADLWGTTWTADEVNADAFAVHLAYYSDSANATFQVDFVRVTIYYTESGTSRSQVIVVG